MTHVSSDEGDAAAVIAAAVVVVVALAVDATTCALACGAFLPAASLIIVVRSVLVE